MAQKRAKGRLKDHVPNKWKHFERLVAAIHQAADRGALVHWDEEINGRQFDVTIRFRKGLYDHLTVIECKDVKKAVSVERVEAFVTKARDAQANVAVLASTSGFQSGAKECGKRHGIVLLQVKEGSAINVELFGAELAGSEEVIQVQSVTLHYVDGTRKVLPAQANVLTYYTKQTILERAGTQTNLDTVLTNYLNNQTLSEQTLEHVIDIAAGTAVVAPKDGEIPLKPLQSIGVRTAVVIAKIIKGPSSFELSLLQPPINVHNVSTGEITSFDPLSLPLGIGNTFEEGSYYEDPSLGFYYYCHAITNELVELWLVESFQNGQLAQAKMMIKPHFADQYVAITDNTTLKRLRRRRQKLE